MSTPRLFDIEPIECGEWNVHFTGICKTCGYLRFYGYVNAKGELDPIRVDSTGSESFYCPLLMGDWVRPTDPCRCTEKRSRMLRYQLGDPE